MKRFKRNANGSGTVTKLSGNRRKPWCAKLPATEDENGDYKRKVLGYFETRQEAVDALALHRLMPSVIDTNITFESLWETVRIQWYKNVGKSAQNAYNAAYSKLKPIYKLKVVDIKTPQLQFCIDNVESGSKSTYNNMKIVMSHVEEYATQQDLIVKNYAEFVTLPKTEGKERQTFNDVQLAMIEREAENGNEICKHILVMCYTGWRIQEYCNLTVFDYDRKAHTLTGGLKTDAGKNRVVPVPEKVRPYLDEFFAENESIYPFGSQSLRRYFQLTMEELGLKGFTPHCTRHTYNEKLYIADVPVETRMMLMGQSNQQTNIKTYTHSDLEKLSEAVGKL